MAIKIYQQDIAILLEIAEIKAVVHHVNFDIPFFTILKWTEYENFFPFGWSFTNNRGIEFLERIKVIVRLQ